MIKTLFIPAALAISLSSCGQPQVEQQTAEASPFEWGSACLASPLSCLGHVYSACGETYVITRDTLYTADLDRIKHAQTGSPVCQIHSVYEYQPDSEVWRTKAIESLGI